MGEQVQKQRQHQRTQTDSTDTGAADLTNEQLEEDVACCIDDIDKALEESEREQEALRERKERDQGEALKDFYAHYDRHGNGMRQAWEQKYQHLHAYTTVCCGVAEPGFNDDE
jgi:hypothetical protein